MHESIHERLNEYLETNKIPNIIFHGEHGSGKKTLIKNFIDRIYDHDKEKIKTHVMFVNCAIGKGIKFVREDLKYFAKTHIERNVLFKSIVFLNADNLTNDAQSALRRCIELYSTNTRFFMVIEKINNLMKPIISRFCEIYVSKDPCCYQTPHTLTEEMDCCISLIKSNKKNTIEALINLTNKLYQAGCSAMNVMELHKNENEELVYRFSSWRREFRNEKFLILLILNFLFLDNEQIENVDSSFM